MALCKRGKYWHYDFIYRGKRHQGSTDQSNINRARLALAAVRSSVALEAFGIAPPKVAPMFKEFVEGRFLGHVRQHNKKKPRTVAFYEEKARRLLEFQPFVAARISEIDEDLIAKYKDHRSQEKKKRNGDGNMSDASINRELATLRKALNLAYEWKLIARSPRVRTLPGEKNRDFILTGDMETAYLSRTSYPLKQAAILMLDLGLRPEECVRLKKGDVADGSATVRDGKSSNAARSLPLTERASCQIEVLCALWPKSEFLFPGHKKGTHMTRAALDHMHSNLRNTVDSGFPKEFVLYTMRHTFGTRLAESGAGPFEIKAAMGHSDIRVSQKYVHPTAAHLELALKRKELFDRMIRGEKVPEVPAISVARDKIRS